MVDDPVLVADEELVHEEVDDVDAIAEEESIPLKVLVAEPELVLVPVELKIAVVDSDPKLEMLGP